MIIDPLFLDDVSLRILLGLLIALRTYKLKPVFVVIEMKDVASVHVQMYTEVIRSSGYHTVQPHETIATDGRCGWNVVKVLTCRGQAYRSDG